MFDNTLFKYSIHIYIFETEDFEVYLYSDHRGLRFNVVIREDAKVSPFTDIVVKAALSTNLF